MGQGTRENEIIPLHREPLSILDSGHEALKCKHFILATSTRTCLHEAIVWACMNGLYDLQNALCFCSGRMLGYKISHSLPFSGCSKEDHASHFMKLRLALVTLLTLKSSFPRLPHIFTNRKNMSRRKCSKRRSRIFFIETSPHEAKKPSAIRLGRQQGTEWSNLWPQGPTSHFFRDGFRNDRMHNDARNPESRHVRTFQQRFQGNAIRLS